MNRDIEPSWWSWADVVRRSDRLGVPNFQRGAVWSAGNRTALLESVYEQSPCGSFVLWVPDEVSDDPRGHGVPIREFALDKQPMWLVDGQQRTRALLDTFQQIIEPSYVAEGMVLNRLADLEALQSIAPGMPDHTSQGSNGESSVEELTGIWLAVLPALGEFDRERPYFGRHSEAQNIRRGSVFRRLTPLARTRIDSKGQNRPVPPGPLGSIPLAALLSPSSVLSSGEEKSRALAALQGFSVDSLPVLDELLPWGPHFVTGHAFDGGVEAGKSSSPLRWAEVFSRRDESSVREMIDLLTGLFEPEWLSVFTRFRGMFTGNRFAVGWLPPSNVSVAIDAYVRINRAGIRVRAEERALAVLSRARPNLLDDLAKFSKDRDGGEEHPDQRALLTHDSDKQMGFGLWMATLTRYTALALLGDYCRKWLGTAPIDKETFVYRLDRVGPRESETGKATWARPDYHDPAELIQEAAAKTSAALLLLDRALSEHLGFDHRMARPAPRFLLPLIDLFYRIPEAHLKRLSEDCSFLEAVGQLLHWTMLGPYIDQPDLEQFIVEVHGIDEERARERAAPISVWGPHASDIDAALRDAFLRYQQCLMKIWGSPHYSGHEQADAGAKELEGNTLVATLNQLALDSFWREIKSARSLQHPAVGWVYAIERRGRAREFSWRAQSEGYIQSGAAYGVPPATASDRKEELLKIWSGDLRASLYPEKQHIVPFAVARQVVGKGGSRSTASASNAIGNLTWLSRRQNGLDALSDRWAVMDRKTDAENLRARGFLAKTVEDSSGSDVLELYENLREIISAESWRDNQTEALRLYTEFCDGRLSWLCNQMQGWLESPISPQACDWLGISMDTDGVARG